jgi:hypothetical protein
MIWLSLNLLLRMLLTPLMDSTITWRNFRGAGHERQNLNVRMHTRRFTRLTNAFSKKVDNHAHAVALFAMYYNFVRIHKTLRTTPAMAAKVAKRLWEIGDIVNVLETWEGSAK